MEAPNWVYWPDQGKWRAYPEGSPDREIQAASFEELQFKIEHQGRENARPSRGISRVEQTRRSGLNLDASQYVLSQDQGKWRGYLLGSPDHLVQGESFDEVQFKLFQLYRNLNSAKQLPSQKAA
jgi:hypothetical protein